ncbi:hypothetical protein OAR32_00595 [Dehalococcoidia bacterium]|nr:hypothetical protein [Dehalococcoidia bacterium]
MANKRTARLNKNLMISATSKFISIEDNDGAKKSRFKTKELTGYSIEEEPKDSKEIWWSFLGLILSILIWQLSSVPVISIGGSIILVILSLFLFLDYMFTESKIKLILFIGGNNYHQVFEKENMTEIMSFIEST